MIRDDMSMRKRLFLLVFGTLFFIAGAMGPFMLRNAKNKEAVFHERLRPLGEVATTLHTRHVQETERASASMGAAAGILLLMTAACAMLAAQSLVRRLGELTLAARRMREGDLDTRVVAEASTELDQLALALDHMRGDLKQVVALSLQKAELENDAAVASTVHSMFLPQQAEVKSDHGTLRAYYAPAARCGGDWWWHHTRDDGTSLLLVGDVTGHGTGPAMITAAAASAFHTLIAQGLDHDVPALLNAVSETIADTCSHEFFMTLAALHIDASAGLVRLWSAAAPPIFVLSANGQIESLSAPGTRLGEDQLSLGYAEQHVAEGARVLVFTDGLPELTLGNGQQLGLRRLRKALSEGRELNIDDARGALIKLLDQTRKGSVSEDDLTFVLFDVANPRREQAA